MEKATSAVYEFGSYRLETARRLLLHEGKSLTLAPKTFDLLQILVQSRGRVLTKKELMSALWPDSFVEESNLAFQISALRKVLGTKGAEWIETLPKYGYRFGVPVSQIAAEPEDLPKITEPLEAGHPESARTDPSAVVEAVLRAQPSERVNSTAAIWLAIGIVGIAASLFGWLTFRQAKPQQSVVRFLISPPPKVTIQDLDSIALAPDGSQLAFIGEASDGQKQLWLRPLDSVNAEPMAGTELVTAAFWSPDSDSIAFFASGKLKRIDLHGGPPQIICNALAGRGTWSKSGVILIEGPGAVIYKVAATGGEPQPATVLDRDAQETFHASPQFLPDGRHFIYYVGSSRPENTGIYLASLDSKGSKRLVNSNANGAYASVSLGQSDRGYLLYTSGTDLVRQELDLKQQSLVGEPAVLGHRILIGLTRGIARAAFSVSQNGVLAYRTRGETGNTQLVWFDRQGRQLGAIGEPGGYSNPALSPDEKKIVISRTEAPSGARDLWLIDLSSGAASRFTFDPSDKTNAVWSPDSREIAFNAVHDGAVDIYLKPVTGTLQAKQLLASNENKQIECWSPDGSVILYRIDNKTWILPVRGGKPTGPYPMEYPAISPDGRWVAYTSNESGRAEVYVQSFPPTEGRWQVSTTGGTEPLWRRDGKELYYLSGDRLMAVEVKNSLGAFESGVAKVVFEARLESTRRRSRYQVAYNGRRFLVNLPVESSSPITVTLNWAANSKP